MATLLDNYKSGIKFQKGACKQDLNPNQGFCDTHAREGSKKEF